MAQLKETEDIFFGRLAWAGAVEWARDEEVANGEWFRAWEELSKDEQDRYTRIGISIATYIRNVEGTLALMQKLQEQQTLFDAAMAAARKEHKDRGGR